MKFPQGIVVELVNPNTTARYADFKHGNERYVVGSADQPFEVEVTVPASLLAKYPVISGRLSLDGQSVNYTKYVKASDLSGWARTSLCMRFTGFETGWLQSANDISPLRVRTVSNLLRPCQPTQHSLERLVQVVCEVVEEVDRASPSSAGPSCSDLVTLKAAEGKEKRCPSVQPVMCFLCKCIKLLAMLMLCASAACLCIGFKSVQHATHAKSAVCIARCHKAVVPQAQNGMNHHPYQPNKGK